MNLRLALVLLPSLLQAHPGDTLPTSFPTFSSQASVFDSTIAPDGGVFVVGDFVKIDGSSRAGLAKLAQDGTLDDAFIPSPLAASPRGSVGLLWNPDPLPRLFALPGGRLMVLNRESWSLLNSDGTPNTFDFPELSRTAARPPRPQFLEAGRIVMINGEEPVLRAYQTHDLLPEPGFAASPGPRPPAEAIPAAEGKIWVLGREESDNPWTFFSSSGPDHTLYRIEANGAIDPSFTPRELPAERSYTLRAAPNGGFRLIHEWLGRYQFWPVATSRSFTADRYDSAGILQGAISFRLSFGHSLHSVTFQSPDFVILPTLGESSLLIRSGPGSQDPDPAFRIELAGPSLAANHPLHTPTLDTFSNGSLLVGGTRKHLANGTADPNWHVPRLSKLSVASRLVALPGGAFLAGGDFDIASGSPAPGLVRISPDDTIDPSFAPSWDFRFAQKILPLPDDSFLCLFKSPADGNLVRFDSNGGFLSLWPIPPPTGNLGIHYGTATDFAVQSDGTTLVNTFQNSEVPGSGFFRIPPNGLSQPSLDNLLGSGVGPSLLVLHDDSYLRGANHYQADGTFITTIQGITHGNPIVQLPDRSVIFARPPYHLDGPVLQRWHPHVGIDPSFLDPFHGRAYVWIVGIAPAADGKIFVWGNAGGVSLVRLHATGQLDPTFRPPPGEIQSVLSTLDGTLVVGGFLDPAVPLARLTDFRVAGFENWMDAATSRLGWSSQDLTRDADPDGDGVSNFLEYAAGSDPSKPDNMMNRATRVGPLTWTLPSNPEAPEIRRTLESSTDLTHWQPATAQHLRLETRQPVLTWSLLPGSTTLFTRVRIE